MTAAGNQIAAVAQSQVGNTSGWQYTNGQNQAWCDDFASWVLQKAGYQGYGSQAYVPSSVNWAKQNGLWIPNGNGAAPQKGDLVVFDWNGDGTADHIGVVTGVNQNGTISVVSGNTDAYGKTGGESSNSGAVGVGQFSLNGGDIMGFINTANGKGAPLGNAFAQQGQGNPGGQGTAGTQGADTGVNPAAALESNLMGILGGALGSGAVNPSQLSGLENALGNSGAFDSPSNVGSYSSALNNPQKQGIIQLAKQVAQQNGIPVNIFLAIIDHESGFNPSAVGDNGTSFGLGQVHTPAHPDYNVQQALHGNNGQPDVLYQLEYSAHMLVQLHQQYGSWQLAVEHYNGSGPQAVQYSQNVMGLASQIGQNANALG
jgi:hypothetical protein